jgi:ribose transport system substrate-binding protein
MKHTFSLATILFLLICGCGGPQTGTVSEVEEGKLTIAVIPKSTGGEFWQTVETGVRRAAKDLDVKLVWEGTVTETEIAEQNRIIESMVTLDVDGIALAPLNKKAQEKQVRNAVEAGIPVIVFDSAVDGDAHSAFVATNNEQGGVIGADHMAKELGGSGKVVVLRYVQGAGSTEARAKGFIEKAKEVGLEILADPYPDNGQVEGCKMTASNTLQKYVVGNKLEIDGVFAANLYSALGMAGALEDMEKMGIAVDHVCFVGFDTSPKLITILQEGKASAMIAQNPERMGYLAVESIVNLLRGEEIEPFVDTGITVVTADGLKSDADMRKLVGME